MLPTTLAISSQSHFYNVGNIFLTIYFKHFVFMELFHLNSSLNNLSESSSITVFLVEFFIEIAIKLYILPASTKILKSP